MFEHSNERFFYDEKMHKYDEVAVAGDCFNQLIAVLLRKKYWGKYNPYGAYLGDLSFSVLTDLDGYLARSAIKCNEYNPSKKLFKVSWDIVKNDVYVAMEHISKALEQDGYAILRTVDTLLPFSIYYNENFDFKNFQIRGHLIMIVGEDDQKYYFVDQLEEINRKSYEHVSGRLDIGVCSKKDMEKALYLFTGILQIDFNESNIFELSTSDLDDILHHSLDHFFNGTTTRKLENEKTVFRSGYDALQYLEEAPRNGKIFLTRKVFHPILSDYCDVTINREMMNGATGVKNRRIVWLRFLESEDEVDSQVIDDFKEAIHKWELLKNMLIKKDIQKKETIEEADNRYFYEVVESEKKLFNMLKYLI